MPADRDVFRYLHDCYREDSYSPSDLNVFRLGADERAFLEGSDHAAKGFTEPLMLSKEVSKGIRDAMAVAENGLSYTYGFIFVQGSIVHTGGKRLKVAAPLFLRHLSEDENGDFYPSAEFSLNDTLVSNLILDPEEALLAHQAFDEILEAHPNARFERLPLNGWLNQHFSDINSATLAEFPEKLSPLKESAQSDGLAFFPTAAVFLQKDPDARRGILSTLRKLSEGELDPSPSLDAFLGNGDQDTKYKAGLAMGFGSLSQAQEQAVENSKRFPLSIVYGPPGTGKSHTAATLAIDHLAHGKSVLIVSKRKEAGVVIAEKIEKILGLNPGIMEVGRQAELDASVQKIDELLFTQFDKDNKAVSKAKAGFIRSNKRYKKFQRQFALAAKLEAQLGQSGSILDAVAGPIRKLVLSTLPSISPLYKNLKDAKVSRDHDLRELIKILIAQQQADAARDWQSSLQSYRKYIRARKPHTREKYRDDCDFRGVLKVFPVWTATFNDLFRFFPNQPGVFDLVIIDEASQCDLASAIPALLRAQKAVISGDPQQLRHVSFLSNRLQDSFARGVETEAWNYRRMSVLDRVIDLNLEPVSRVFLDEYYRSAEALIAFSNREFYGNRLKCIHSFPGSLVEARIETREVSNARLKRGGNPTEAAAIVSMLEGLDFGSDEEVGIITPFQKQVDALEVQIKKVRGLRERIKNLGTPYEFQGDEVDVLIISLGVTQESHANLWRILNQSNLFNVMITRGRKKVFLFHSFEENYPSDTSLIYNYIQGSATGFDVGLQSKGAFPAIPSELKAALDARGLECFAGLEWLGEEIDLVVQGKQGPVAIDLIGGNTAAGKAFSEQLYGRLERAGITVVPFSLSEFGMAPEETLRELFVQIDEPRPPSSA